MIPRTLDLLLTPFRDAPDDGAGGGGGAPDVEALTAQVAALTAQVATLTTERDALKKGGGDAEVRRLKAELRAKTAEVTTLTGERDTLKATVATLEGQVTETTTKAALKDAGIDVEDADYVLGKYAKAEAAEGEDKPDFATWLAEQKAAKASWYVKIATPVAAAPAAPAKPAATSAATPAQPVAQAAPATPPAPAAVAPPAPAPDAAAARTVVTTKATANTLTAADIRAMTPEQYKVHRAAVRASVGAPIPSAP